MESGLNNILIISLILVTGCVVVFLIFLIQILGIIKRILKKVESAIDNLDLTQEEIKLKILNFIDEIIRKIKSYGKEKITDIEDVTLKKLTGGGEGEEKNKRKNNKK